MRTRTTHEPYVLDTDIVSLFQHDHPAVVANIQKHPLDELAITVLTVEEQLSGWYNELRKAKKPSALAAVYLRMALTVGSWDDCLSCRSRSRQSSGTRD